MRIRSDFLPRLAALVLTFVAASAHAATMLGTVYRGAQPAAGVELELSCGGSSVRGRSDDNGRYRMTINGSGKCFVKVAGSSARIEVILFDASPARVELALEGAGAGATLRRR